MSFYSSYIHINALMFPKQVVETFDYVLTHLINVIFICRVHDTDAMQVEYKQPCRADDESNEARAAPA